MLEVLEHQASNTRSFANPAASKDCEQIPELYLRAMVDSYSAAVAVLDESGNILYVNRGWRDFLVRHGSPGDFYGVGSNYLNIRRRQADPWRTLLRQPGRGPGARGLGGRVSQHGRDRHHRAGGFGARSGGDRGGQ